LEKVRVESSKLYYGFPVILVSYYDANHAPNISTMSSSFSLGNTVCLGFGSGGHAIQCIKQNKEFVINVPDQNLTTQMEMCGFATGSELNKFELTGLTPVPSELVNAPLVAECPISLECRVLSVETPEESPGITVAIATVLGRYVSSELLDDQQHLLSEKIDPVLFVGDQHQRKYRYLDGAKSDDLESFLPDRKDVVWR
jgi:flavin reductase (DIM6/NTAB) family NADH-FMN oxidoreductase RutF